MAIQIFTIVSYATYAKYRYYCRQTSPAAVQPCWARPVLVEIGFRQFPASVEIGFRQLLGKFSDQAEV